MSLPFLLSLPLPPFLLGGSLCVPDSGQILPVLGDGPLWDKCSYLSLEAGLAFKTPGQAFKPAPLKSYGLLSGTFCCEIIADAVSQWLSPETWWIPPNMPGQVRNWQDWKQKLGKTAIYQALLTQNPKDSLLILWMEESIRLNTIVPSKWINCYGNANESDKICAMLEWR